MKHKLLYLLSLFLLMPFGVQSQEAPQHRVVFLWDVTYSTHGFKNGKETVVVKVAGKDMSVKCFDKKYNIYDDLVNALIESIKSQNPESEIIVVPFNNKVLTNSIWRAMGTSDGKKYLIDKINSFYNSDQTWTNIYTAFEYAKNNLFEPKAKYWSDLYVLTDGGHTDKKPPIPLRTEFHDMLRNWCDFAVPNNINGYYYLLTDAVYAEDPELEKILTESDCIKPFIGIPKGGFVAPTNQYSIKGSLLVNLKDQYNQPLKLSVVLNNAERPIQGAEKVRIYLSSNPYFELDEVVTIDGKAIVEVTPKPLMSLLELQRSMPTDENTVLVLNFEQEKGENQVNELVNKSCELRYVNKPQKTLTISIKQ